MVNNGEKGQNIRKTKKLRVQNKKNNCSIRKLTFRRDIDLELYLKVTSKSASTPEKIFFNHAINVTAF